MGLDVTFEIVIFDRDQLQSMMDAEFAIERNALKERGIYYRMTKLLQHTSYTTM